MTKPITNAETMSEEPQSFDPINTDDSGKLTVTIVHHNGSVVVSGFDRIEEIDTAASTLRVWYSDSTDPSHVDYHGATITEVRP